MQSWKKFMDTAKENHLVYQIHLTADFKKLNRQNLKADFYFCIFSIFFILLSIENK